MTATSPIIALIGPTGVGKTALALALARRWGAEIVGADASQIYRGLDIGTGKVAPDELGELRHHLIDVAAPDESFDAAAYVRLAEPALAEIRGRGHHALLCGGTGLYIRALVDGLCEAPPVAPDVRAALLARLAAGEARTLHGELATVDPEAAARIAPADHPRLERALGVYLTTLRSLTQWQRAGRDLGPRHDVRYLGLSLPRDVLRERIAGRTRAMFDAGLIDEVRGLEAAGHARTLRSLQALGYRQASACLHGELTRSAAIEETIVATRQYAKRQETWFRAVPGVTWHDARTPKDVLMAWVESQWGPP